MLVGDESNSICLVFETSCAEITTSDRYQLKVDKAVVNDDDFNSSVLVNALQVISIVVPND